jgi:hypothetical protein
MERRASWLRAASEEKGRAGPKAAGRSYAGAGHGCAWRGEHREEWKSEAEGEQVRREHLGLTSLTQECGHAEGLVVEDGSGWPRVIHGGAASSAWRPHRHFIE